jgi:hypothetical protein
MGRSKRDKKRKRQIREREARQAAKANAKEFPDPRATFAQILAMGDVPVDEETFAVVVEPIRVQSGDVLMFQSPHVAPFYLLTAKALRDRADERRDLALRETVTTPDGSLRPADPAAAFDALEGLALCVILSAAAIEAHANDVIGRLDEDATMEVERRGVTVVYDRESLIRWLSLEEKVAEGVRLHTGHKTIKGTKPWEAFKRVTRLRNELVHVKREAENDPDDPGPFGKLMLGEGSRAPEDAASLIEAVEPGWIPEHVRPLLGLK